jgi:cytoskeletal protein CcmA (bactofilin family)
VTSAAGDLTVASGASIGGRAWMSGRTIRLEGTLEQEAHIAGDHVLIGGNVHGPLHVVAQRLELLPTAHVFGTLSYEGPAAATVAPGAVLDHTIHYTHIPARTARDARWPRAATSVLFGFHVFFGGLVLLLLIPRFAGEAARTLATATTQSLIAGLSLVVTVPIAALLLMISAIGFPVGVVLIATYGAALFVGVITTAIFVGNAEATLLRVTPAATRGRPLLLLLAGVVTLAVLRAMPLVGIFVVPTSVVVGLGAVGVWTYGLYRRAAAVPEAA